MPFPLPKSLIGHPFYYRSLIFPLRILSFDGYYESCIIAIEENQIEITE